MKTRLALALPVLAVFGLTSVAHSAPKSRIDAGHLKPGEKVELEGGHKIPKEEYLEHLNKLQEALETDGISLRKSDNRSKQSGKLYTHADAAADHARDHAALTQKAALLRQHEIGGFGHLLVKKGTGAAPRSAVAAPPPSPKAPSADDDPLAVSYEETLGNNKRAAIYVGLCLKDTGDTSAVGCDASLDGGVYLFDNRRQLVKLGAGGRITQSQMSGSLDLYLLGKAVDGYPKKGTTKAQLSKAIAPPAAKMQYGWGPLSIGIEGAIAGEFKAGASNTQEAANAAHKGKCALDVEPSVRATGKATAQVSAVVFKAAMQGTIVFIDLKAPVHSAVAAKPPNLVEDFNAHLDASFLDGEVTLVIQTRIPSGWHFWDVDWHQVYTKHLFDWKGLKVNQKLASFQGKQTKL
jgi:hypothetical protein